jgi:hypothetical protein
MSEIKPIISPKTKFGELLDAFPHLEKILLELSPAFAKLKNPVLRKTVARVASLQQAAVVGGLKVDELVNRLRREVGQDEFSGSGEEGNYLVTSPPDWFDADRVTQYFDAIPILNSGGSPMAVVISIARSLSYGEILELKTPFVPAPIIDMLITLEFRSFSMRMDENILNYFEKL